MGRGGAKSEALKSGLSLIADDGSALRLDFA